MLIENPQPTAARAGAPYCAVRRRNADGSANIGGEWLEPMGPIGEFVEDQVKWEVVFYKEFSEIPK